MKKYFAFFRIRFHIGLQYRSSSVVALITQFLWGFMECLAYKALLDTNAVAFPMDFSALVSYIWLKEAFFALFTTWMTDNEIFTMIIDGGIAYELCRPISIYNMWFFRNIGSRLAAAALRCGPIILAALLLPKPYRLMFPNNMISLCLFITTMFLGLCITVSFCMLVYILSFFTISPQGLRMVLTGAVEFLSGSIIPLPFIPNPVRSILELLPFASMQNVPLRIYGGDLAGIDMIYAMILQIFWLFILILFGKAVCRLAERRVVIQGG